MPVNSDGAFFQKYGRNDKQVGDSTIVSNHPRALIYNGVTYLAASYCDNVPRTPNSNDQPLSLSYAETPTKRNRRYSAASFLDNTDHQNVPNKRYSSIPVTANQNVWQPPSNQSGPSLFDHYYAFNSGTAPNRQSTNDCLSLPVCTKPQPKEVEPHDGDCQTTDQKFPSSPRFKTVISVGYENDAEILPFTSLQHTNSCSSILSDGSTDSTESNKNNLIKKFCTVLELDENNEASISNSINYSVNHVDKTPTEIRKTNKQTANQMDIGIPTTKQISKYGSEPSSILTTSNLNYSQYQLKHSLTPTNSLIIDTSRNDGDRMSMQNRSFSSNDSDYFSASSASCSKSFTFPDSLSPPIDLNNKQSENSSTETLTYQSLQVENESTNSESTNSSTISPESSNVVEKNHSHGPSKISHTTNESNVKSTGNSAVDIDKLDKIRKPSRYRGGMLTRISKRKMKRPIVSNKVRGMESMISCLFLLILLLNIKSPRPGELHTRMFGIFPHSGMCKLICHTKYWNKTFIELYQWNSIVFLVII